MGLIARNPDQENLPEGSEAEPSAEERRALIERVARSEQFSRSMRLRDFLLYVGKQSLKEGCPEINEQEVGHHVFGRPASYDRSQDNIVRVNATELRKRIEAYFASDGAHESLIFDIPRGGYKPVFRRRLPEDNAHPQPAVEQLRPHDSPPLLPSPKLHPPSSRLRVHLVWASACLLLAVACVVLFLQNRAMQKTMHPWLAKPAVAAFWGDFFHNGNETDIVLPDDSATVIEEVSHQPATLRDYLSGDYMRQILASGLSTERKDDINRIFVHNLITYGAYVAAMKIVAVDPLSTTLHLTAARFFQSDLLKRDNVILLGGKKANPWVYLFDDQINFDVQSSGFGVVVVNHHPQGAELPVYGETSTDKGPVGYSVIAYLPNPSRTRNTIIVAGTQSDATNAAAEFLTSEDRLVQLQKLFHADRLPYFEVLLRTSQLTGTSFNAEIVAYRTYPALH